MGQKTVNALVDGGKATPAPPLGPSLAQFKVNIGKVIQDINEKTKDYQGMKVPVKIIIDDVTKDYKIEVGTPPVSSLIRKELGLKKIASEKKQEEVEETERKKKGKKGGEKGKPEDKETKEKDTEKKPEGKEGKDAEEKEEPEGETKPEEKSEEAVEKEEPKEREMVGNLTIDQCIKIAKMKRDVLLAKDMKKAVKEIVASCVSMPITVENKNPKEVLKDIDAGKYDSKISD